MNKVTSVDIFYQDYSDCDSGLPSHWCAIIHHTGSSFAVHLYGDNKQDVSKYKVGDVFND